MLASSREIRRKELLCEMMDGNGTIQNDAEGIANALADFYETLYRVVSDVVPGYGSSTDTSRECRPVTRKEVSKQLDKMKVGKTADSSCTVAEFFKFAGDEMKDLLADLFSDILAGKGRVPQYWKGVTIQVLFKKGERHSPSHYRPISIIPIISKLFSRILLAGLDLKPQPLWVAALDFQKAPSVTKQCGKRWESSRSKQCTFRCFKRCTQTKRQESALVRKAGHLKSRGG